MRKLLTYILVIATFAISGCKDSNDDEGNKAPQISRFVNPLAMEAISVVNVYDLLQIDGKNLGTVTKIMINTTEIPVSAAEGTSCLPDRIIFKMPGIPAAENYTLSIENPYGSVKVPIELNFPPLAFSGMVNEFAPLGGELELLGQSMEFYLIPGTSKVYFNDKPGEVLRVETDRAFIKIPQDAPNKSVIKFTTEKDGDVICPVRYRDNTYMLLDFDGVGKTTYPQYVVEENGNKYARIKAESGVKTMVYDDVNAIDKSFFDNSVNYDFKFEIRTNIPIYYRFAITLNNNTNFMQIGPSSASKDPAKTFSTDGEWITYSIPLSTWPWRAATALHSVKVYIGSQPAGYEYDFMMDNFRLVQKNWQ